MLFKTFMIYNEYYSESRKNMQHSIKSYDSTWQIQAYDGCAPNNLTDFEKKYPLPDTDRYKQHVSNKKYISKKCCFYSHFSLWDHCAKNLEYIVIVENDVEAAQSFPVNLIGSFINSKNNSVGLQITTETSAMYRKNKKHIQDYYTYTDGIHPIYHKVGKTGKKFFLGATGYVLNNSACRYLLNDCQINGWAQNDLLFNADDDFSLYFLKPSVARYIKDKENSTSSVKI